MQDNNNFEVVLTTKSKSKNSIENILIETSVNGLIYRTEVFMNNHLIDAVEVNCSDISTIDKYEEIFKARYTAHHSKLEEKYTQKKIFSKVATTDGDYIDGEGVINIITSVSDKTYKVEAFLDSNQLDIFQEEVSDADEKVFKAKYTQAHKDFVKKYAAVLRFPANTFINPVIKKFPFYKKSPMTAFMFFLAAIALVIWIISIIVCGKALKKIVKAVAGKEAALVVKDLQKTMCKKSADEADAQALLLDENGKLINNSALSDFVVIPKDIKFETDNRIYTVYIKNNKPNDVLIVLRDRVIYNFENALVDPNMVVNVLNKEAVHIKAGKVGYFEFKLESSFLQSDNIEEIAYNGTIVLDVSDLVTRKATPLVVGFEFSVQRDDVTNPGIQPASKEKVTTVEDTEEIK